MLDKPGLSDGHHLKIPVTPTNSGVYLSFSFSVFLLYLCDASVVISVVASQHEGVQIH